MKQARKADTQERPHTARYPPCTKGMADPLPPPAAALCLWGVLASLYRQQL